MNDVLNDLDEHTAKKGRQITGCGMNLGMRRRASPHAMKPLVRHALRSIVDKAVGDKHARQVEAAKLELIQALEPSVFAELMYTRAKVTADGVSFVLEFESHVRSKAAAEALEDIPLSALQAVGSPSLKVIKREVTTCEVLVWYDPRTVYALFPDLSTLTFETESSCSDSDTMDTDDEESDSETDSESDCCS